jgi:hypothetical protein
MIGDELLVGLSQCFILIKSNQFKSGVFYEHSSKIMSDDGCIVVICQLFTTRK